MEMKWAHAAASTSKQLLLQGDAGSEHSLCRGFVQVAGQAGLGVEVEKPGLTITERSRAEQIEPRLAQLPHILALRADIGGND